MRLVLEAAAVEVELKRYRKDVADQVLGLLGELGRVLGGRPGC